MDPNDDQIYVFFWIFLLVGLVLGYYTCVTLDIRTGMQSYKELTLYTISLLPFYHI